MNPYSHILIALVAALFATGCGGAFGSPESAPLRSQPDTPTPITVTLAFAGDYAGLRGDGVSWHRMPRCSISEGAERSLAEANLAFANLEGPIVEPTDAHFSSDSDRVWLGSELDDLNALARLGVDVLSLANNHSCDTPYSTQEFAPWFSGFGMTISGLRSRALPLLDIGGTPSRYLAVISMTVIPPNADSCAAPPVYVDTESAAHLFRSVASENSADVYVVSLHWGVEYEELPTQAQRELAEALHEAGAHIVWGHHSHTAQEVATHDVATENGRVTIFSAGNLCLDTPGSSGIVVRVDASVNNEGEVDARVVSTVSTQPD